MILSSNPFQSQIRTEITFGINSVQDQLIEQVKQFNKKKAFIATDPGLIETNIPSEIKTLLKESGFQSVVFSEVEPNPLDSTVMRGVENYKESDCDIIIAVGGGSSLDFAKAVGTMVNHSGDILDYRRGERPISNKLPPLIAIPTTVGTGSEVTPFAIITDEKEGRKYSVANPLLFPDVALIDPNLTLSLPQHIVATTAIDALVHAIEAYTAKRANPLSTSVALQAVKMLHDYLPASYAQKNNFEARSQVQMASTLAGIALALSGVGLVHSCSHPMSAVHDVPHGLANAILLPYVIEYNLIASFPKYAHIARIFDPLLINKTDEQAARQLVTLLKQFTKSLNIPKNFSYLNFKFTEDMVDRLSNDAMNDISTVTNNLREVNKNDVVQIYKNVLPM